MFVSFFVTTTLIQMPCSFVRTSRSQSCVPLKAINQNSAFKYSCLRNFFYTAFIVPTGLCPYVRGSLSSNAYCSCLLGENALFLRSHGLAMITVIKTTLTFGWQGQFPSLFINLFLRATSCTRASEIPSVYRSLGRAGYSAWPCPHWLHCIIPQNSLSSFVA